MLTTTSGLNTFAAWSAVLLVVVLGCALVIPLAARRRYGTLTPQLIVSTGIPLVLFAAKIVNNDPLELDQQVWHTRALQVMQHFDGTLSGSVDSFGGKDGYVWIVGAIYHVVGPVPAVPMIINIILWSTTILVICATAELLLERYPSLSSDAKSRGIKLGTWILAVSPAIFIWVPSLLRETVSGLLITVAAYNAIIFLVRRQLGSIALLAGSLWLLYWIRDSIGLGTAMAIMLGILLARVGESKYRSAIRLFYACAITVVAIPVWGALSNRFGLGAEEIVQHNVSLSNGAASGFFNASGGTPGYSQLILQVMPRVIAGPFPWEWSPSGGVVLAILSLASWALFLIPALRTFGRRSPDFDDDLGPMLVVWIVTIALLAMITMSASNYGILARFRAMPTVAIAPLACVGYALLMERLATRRALQPKSLRHSNRES